MSNGYNDVKRLNVVAGKISMTIPVKQITTYAGLKVTI